MLRDLSLKWYGECEGTFGGASPYVTGGYGNVLTRLAGELAGIRLRHVVQRLEWTHGSVVVTAHAMDGADGCRPDPPSVLDDGPDPNRNPFLVAPQD